ncbi:MAG: carbamoyltransferase HypF [Kofleriaceae bacterium]|nr:carbamoyltransferase HypF [Kofleriaceae bacterium]
MSGRRIEIRGTVQGVGFRPWVYRLAHELGVAGRVRNHARGVTVEAFGGDAVLDDLVARLRDAPAPAHVRALSSAPIPGEEVDDFVIDHSAAGGDRALSIPPDLATCPACLAELADPADRRFGYPFINCTHCGPRFTIATGIPYDRPATTMAPFTMCPACQREYDDPDDRRFHAQPDACPVCGPRLALWGPDGTPLAAADPLAAAAARLIAGEIVAVKGLGGFHLACDATRAASVVDLRARKRRDARPFAIMVRDLAAAHAVASLDAAEVALLTAPERPIVVARRRPGAAVVAEVAPDSGLVGVMLPYTPLHHLLLAAVDRPLVMTSGNLSEEPICADEREAIHRLHGLADALLVHDRAIATRCDDSVARVIDGRPTLLRRSRGHVPRAIALARSLRQPVLGCGGQLKNTFCLAAGDSAYLGPHIGDLDALATLTFFEQAIARMEAILEVTPAILAHDLHPGYLSTRYALERDHARLIGVQHHHAHVAAAMAEHGLDGPVIGVAYDGTGWGPDGTAWGGELLLARLDGFTRLATFRPIALAGGDAAIRAPWRIALALLDDAFAGAPPLDELALFGAVPGGDVEVVTRMIQRGIQTPRARGVGRYFDGVAALALARPRSRHEGQLAMAWDDLAAAGDHGRYPWSVDDDAAVPELDLRPMIRAIVDDLRAGVAAAVIAARFHDTLIAATAAAVRDAVAAVGRLPVVLTGGVFQNPRLAVGIHAALADLDVRGHRDVPPGDGGLALGQVVVADAIARSEA